MEVFNTYNMKKKLLNLKVRILRLLGDLFIISPLIHNYIEPINQPRSKVLVVGVVLQDRKNHYKHISSIFNDSKCHNVDQIWAVLKSHEKFEPINNVKHIYIDEFIPRSKLINTLIEGHINKSYDYIVITDDDIRLPNGFVDQFLMRQEEFNFSLAQPARTPDSIISHQITKQNRNILARQTLFVEIGPLVSIRRDAQELILPLDEKSPMGWGLDYVWPVLIEEDNKKMGVIDCTPIAHTLRPVGKSYDAGKAVKEMSDFLASRTHLSAGEAHVVLNTYHYLQKV